MRGRLFLCEPRCSHPLYFRGLRLVEKTFIPMTTTIIKASIIRVRENKGQKLWLHSSRIPPVVAGGGRGCRPSLSLQNYCWRGFAKAKSLRLLHNNELTTTQPTYGCFHRGQTIYWRIIWSHKLVMIPFAIIILSLFLHAKMLHQIWYQALIRIAIAQRTYSVSIEAKGFIGKSYEGRIGLCFECVFVTFKNTHQSVIPKYVIKYVFIYRSHCQDSWLIEHACKLLVGANVRGVCTKEFHCIVYVIQCQVHYWQTH